MAEPIDRTHLERLAARFGAEFLVELIDLFVAQGKERLDAAEQGIATGDADAIVAAAHSLKSSAGNLGAAALGQRAAEIERRGRNGAAADVLAPMVGSLRDAFTKACAALEVMRADIARRIA
ncbi:MAG: hypothetical protein DMD26_10000 [Gemmatimonadetes bacterium]|jgi:two-component system, sensor histidine kinase and response regulator|nr:MAG: hypothetical protein DMD26_10000 [Gemmatimonadota bacterium]